jgi:hypothetical protein
MNSATLDDSTPVYLACQDCDEPVQTTYRHVKNCTTITNIIADCGACSDAPVPLPCIKRATFDKVMMWLQHQIDEPVSFDEKATVDLTKFTDWENDFYSKMTITERLDFIMACNYIECKTMYMETARYIALTMKGKTIEEIRAMFGLGESPLSAEELEKIANETEFTRDETSSVTAPVSSVSSANSATSSSSSSSE